MSSSYYVTHEHNIPWKNKYERSICLCLSTYMWNISAEANVCLSWETVTETATGGAL